METIVIPQARQTRLVARKWNYDGIYPLGWPGHGHGALHSFVLVTELVGFTEGEIGKRTY